MGEVRYAVVVVGNWSLVMLRAVRKIRRCESPRWDRWRKRMLGREKSYLASLVLGHLVLGVLAALPALAVGASRLGNVHLEGGDVRVCND